MNQSLTVYADKLRALRGWRRSGAAFGAGAISALAFPPLGFFPVLWLCFPVLLLLLQGTAKPTQAFRVGWSFAFGGFLFGWYWIAAALFVDIRQFWWAVPLCVAGLPAFFAIYYGLAMALARRVGLHGLAGILIFALLWFLADYARGKVFGGFPWDFEGYAWVRVLPVLQIVSVIGIYGLTLLTILATSLPTLLVDGHRHHRWIVIGSIIALGLLGIWGEGRLSRDHGATVPNLRLRVVQPNIEQANKWADRNREDNFWHLLDLSSARGEKPVTHIIWPETAATFYLMEDEGHRRALAAHVPEGGAILTGVIRRNRDPSGDVRYYNSLIAVDNQARVVAGYDKFHLVPFGEFIPLRSFLPLPTLANLSIDFSAGDGPHSLRVQGLPPFSPLVCFEAIFSGDVVDPTDRPGFLVNITNDGWYGHTAGPYQHFAIVKTRAIEEGLPLVRAANTGISGVVDPYGRVVVRLGLGESGFADADLPQALAPTLFSRYGEKPLWALFVALAAGVALVKWRVEN